MPPYFQKQICAHTNTIHSLTPRNSYSAVRLSTRLLTHIPFYLDAQDSAQLNQTNNKICHLGDYRAVSIETKYKYVVLISMSTSYSNQHLRALKFSTRRSLYRLQLKFVQTTAEVCTDFAEVLSLGSARSFFTSLYQ